MLLFFYAIKPSFLQDIRTITLFEISEKKYQCNSVGCSPSTLIYSSNLRGCQLSCLASPQCRTLSFDLNNNQCELFVDIPKEFGTLVSQVNVTTMIAIDNRESSARK
jgi:hypothetical protein